MATAPQTALPGAFPSRAMVFAAGKGERMGPLTERLAKPALPLGGVPLLTRILRGLAAAGVREVVVNLHHRPESVEPLLRSAETRPGSAEARPRSAEIEEGLTIHRSPEPELLGTSGGLSRAVERFGDAVFRRGPFWVVNGDTLTLADLGAMARFHAGHGGEATLLAVADPGPAFAGERRLAAAADGTILGLTEPGGEGFGFAGVWIVEPSALRLLRGGPGGLSGDLLPGLIRAGSARVFPTEAPWFEIGTPRRYLEASLAAAEARLFPEDPVAPGGGVAPDAVVEDSVLLDGARVEAGARVARSVVAAGEVVPAGAEIRDALFAGGAAHVL